MRTYSRKRIKHELIEDVHDLCRLCLEKPDSSVPIYNGQDNICATLALRIMICVGLEVTRDECLPNVVCSECYKELERYYTFRKKCEVTYQKLKSHALAVKEQKENKTNDAYDPPDSEITSVIKDEILTNEIVEQDVNPLVLPCKEDIKEEVGPNNINSLIRNDLNLGNMDEQVQNNQYEAQLPPVEDANFEEFLSTVLFQLGVLATVDNRVTLLDKNVKTLELETGNGNFLVELVEEAEETKQEVLPEIVQESLPSQNIVQNKPVKQTVSKRSGDSLRCGECGKQFATRSVLSRHQRVHSGERPHACRVCSRRFAQRAVMIRHELVHKGDRLKAKDVVKAGIATHFVPSRRLYELEKLLSRCNNDIEIRTLLSKFNEPPEEFSLAPNIKHINYCFAASTIEEIIERLEKVKNDWSAKTLKTLEAVCPGSLKITLRALQRGAQLELPQCLRMEYRLSCRATENHDFPEGVRALLIDKDNNPKWNPKTLAEVTEDYVEDYFKKLPEERELKFFDSKL